MKKTRKRLVHTQCSVQVYRRDCLHAYLILLPFTLSCFTDMAFFLETEGLWQPRVNKGCQYKFSNNVCSLCVSASHSDNSHNISKLFIIIIFVMGSVITNLFFILLKFFLNWSIVELQCCVSFSTVHQLYIYIYPLFFKLFSHIGHYRVLSSVP